jgi:hypothetical protein
MTVFDTWFPASSLHGSNRINVKSFGAVGNYSHDDTTAFQAALDYCKANTIRTLVVPAGAYIISSTLNQGCPINWRGDGKQTYSNDFAGGTTLAFTGTGDGISVSNSGDYSGYYWSENTSFNDMELFHTSANSGSVHHAISFSLGAGGANFFMSSGSASNLQFTGWTGSCFWNYVTGGLIPYFQNCAFDNISMSTVGQFMGHDTYSGPIFNIASFRNINLENAVATSAGTAHAFFDFTGGDEVLCENILYEPSNANPTLFMFSGNTWINIKGLHLENSSVTNVLEFLPAVSGGCFATLESVAAINQPTGKFILFNGCSQTTVNIKDLNSALDITSFVDWGTGSFNYINVDDFGLSNGGHLGLTPDLISKIKFNGAVLRGAASPVSPVYFSQRETEYISKKGQWLDGIYGGPVVVSVSGDASIGMYDDSNEGRVFEIVSTSGAVPTINFTLTAPTDLVDNQFVIAMRYYVVTSQGTLDLKQLSPGGANAATVASFSVAQTPNNAWYNAYIVAQAPNTIATLVQTQQGSVSPSGTTKLRIAAIYVGSGREIPYLVGGGAAGKAITWSAAAAPIYGSYYVGDTVINNVPASGQPKGWVCTVAGSSGTWVSLGNL